jgi:hypothetical protein
MALNGIGTSLRSFFQGVPGMTVWTLTKPFGARASTLRADEQDFNFCHATV